MSEKKDVAELVDRTKGAKGQNWRKIRRVK